MARKKMRVMGLDMGTKWIGVAVSDETAAIAQGKERLKRASDTETIEKIRLLAGEYDVGKIVVGLPINMDGTLGERARDSRKFAHLLEQRIKVSVALWDERLSTKEAENVMIKANLSRKKRKKAVDKLAAQIILQNYLDTKYPKGKKCQNGTKHVQEKSA